MNSKTSCSAIGLFLFSFLLGGLAGPLTGYEMFIFRVSTYKENMLRDNRIVLHGEFFGQLLYPSSFPSFNDLSGPDDRWNFGFHNLIHFTPTTVFHAQLITHDQGGRRTKFDWHFSLHQNIGRHISLALGHDSDHDSDHASYLNGKPFYNNRNYFDIGLPLGGQDFLIEPFVRFFHHTNQRTHLDLSGDKLKQEYGIRLGAALSPQVILSFQWIEQSSRSVHAGEAWLADLEARFCPVPWLEVLIGWGTWKDRKLSSSGNKQSFSKFSWGIAIPF
jgi:hypothetical protein